MLSYDIKFVTNDESLQLKHNEFKTSKYETKKRVDETLYEAGKRDFCDRRGGHWRAPRSRQIRQLEGKLRDRSIVICEWTNESLITIVFSSGAIAYLTVKPDTLDVTQVLFDRYCVGKLSGQTVTGVVFSKTHLLFLHLDRVATLVIFGKNVTSLPCKITDRDPNIQTIELGGGSRRGERKVSWCENGGGVRALVWGASVEPAPWSPALEDRANLHVYQLTGQQISLVAYHQLENETLLAELSNTHDNIVHIVEQSACHKNGVTLEWVRYDISLSDQRPCKLSSIRDSCTRVSLPAPARAVSRATNARLLTACIDGSLHVIHRDAGVTHSTRAGFIATEILWAGELIIAAEENGRIQCFDRALTLLHHHAKCLDLTPYLRDSRRMQLLATQGVRGGRIILVSLTGGPLTLLRIRHPRLLTAWIRAGRISNAVSLLRSMDWDTEGSHCLWAVNALVVSALRRPLKGGVLGSNGGEDSAQAALGAYLAPLGPHPPAAEKYAPPVHDIARKFFHHLLRRGRIEKALSLAVDLCAWDLFMDARWAAARLGLTQQAGEAASLAARYALQQPESECSDSCSQCSSHSYSGSDYETSASSEPVKTKPPPLPRVPLPSTLLQVPITQSEPTSTNSIRPNLHQYLERDNTIWTTNVKEEYDRFKPILTSQIKWHSVDNMLNYKQGPSKHSSLVAINEDTSQSVVDVIPRTQDERATATHFRHLFQTELREEAPGAIYRYHNTNYHINDGGRMFKHTERSNRSGEKNKVKFSDTVTIAVVSEAPVPARELADSLPLCPPHAYLAAFAPPAPGTAAPLDYVEV